MCLNKLPAMPVFRAVCVLVIIALKNKQLTHAMNTHSPHLLTVQIALLLFSSMQALSPSITTSSAGMLLTFSEAVFKILRSAHTVSL